ncbi:MAG: hypothetical protein ACSLFQ_07350 [Thermoanaerobaculia bacterium]
MRLSGRAAALLLVIFVSSSAYAVTRTWSQTAGGSTGSWTNGGLWMPSGVPQTADDIRITEPGSYSCTTGANFTIRTLTIGGSSGGKFVEVSPSTGLNMTTGGTLNGNATLSVRGSITDGRLTVNQGGFLQLRTGSMVMGNDPIMISNGLFVNEGSEIRGRSLTNDGGRFDQKGRLVLSEGSSITNAGILDIFEGNVDRGSGAGGSITNNSLMRMRTTTPVTIGVDVTNNDEFEVGAGSVTFASAAYTQVGGKTTVSGGSLAGQVNINGGTFSGTGTVNGNFVNGGTIQLAAPISFGQLTVNGTFAQQPTGVVQIKIGSANQFDRLVISGLATLGGQLSLSFLGGFVPTAGMQFPIITFGTSLGQFAIQNGFQVGGVVMKPQYGPNGVSLVAQLASTACGSDSLCLLTDRFDVTLTARDPRTGATGAGVPTQQNDVFGYFTIPALTGNTQNPEVIFKMLDGRGVNQKFWVFYGGLTDFEYTLTIFDRIAATTRTYTKPGGQFVGGADTSAVGKRLTEAPLEPWLGLDALDLLSGREALDDPPVASGEAGCITSGDALCVLAGRFRIRLTAKDPRTGATGAGVAIAQNDLYGYFGIPSLTGNPGNIEVSVKMLDARAENGKFWIFYGGLTDFEYTLTVTDTSTNATKTYTKPGSVFTGGADTSAF